MFKSVALEHPLLLAFILFIACCVASAQIANTSGLEAYTAAMKQSRIGDRIPALERFLALGDNGILKVDALQVLAWDYRQLGALASSQATARQLLALDADNALALALLSERDDQSSAGSRNVSENQFAMATRGLNGLGRLRKPEGMLPANFTLVQRQLTGILNGVVGLGYLDHQDHDNARDYLKRAVDIDPNNPRYIYGMALALLLARNPDTADGYWYLARAVNLTQGTPSGAQVSSYARTKYHEAGGTESDWDRFLAATALPHNVESAHGTASASPVSSSAVNSPAPMAAKPSTPTASTATPASSASIPAKPSTPAAPVLTARSTDAHPELNPAAHDSATRAPARPKPGMSAPNAPISLGILVQTSLLSGGNRHEIIAAMTEMVRKLRPEDEAFIMAFSNQLDFEQDLTANDQLLEEAMSQLQPKSGAALLDGVEFAAGHLKRIGKNPNRVLLIISDGRNASNKPGTTMLSAQLKDVRVDCIGVAVDDDSGKALLERLATYSGGHASFAAGPEQFRAAASQMAQTLGIQGP